MSLSKASFCNNAIYKAALTVGMMLFLSACETSSPTSADPACTRSGYFKSVSVGKYYVCRFDAATNRYTMYYYDCPEGKEFDEALRRCI